MNSPSSRSQELSPNSSPYHARRRSVSDSPKVSPKQSPMTLKRSDAYRNKTKKIMPSRTFFDLRKKTDSQDLRSKSVSEISHVFNKNKEDLTSNRSSVSEDSISEERESDNSGECNPKIDKPKKGTGLRRRQSFQSFIGSKLSNLKEDYTPRLTRSNSTRLSNKRIDNKTEIKSSKSKEKGEYDGPLFLATTLFVPGYDFDTKKQCNIADDRKLNLPLFARRGSRDKILPGAFNRNIKERKSGGSTPTLFRKNSKEKIKITKESQNEIKDTVKKYSPLLDSKKLIPDRADKKSEKASSSSSIKEKQNQLKAKYKRFEELGTCNELTFPIEKIAVGKVRNISTNFESGSIFVNKTKTASSSDKELSMLSQQNTNKSNTNDNLCESKNNSPTYKNQTSFDTSDFDTDINDEAKVADNEVFEDKSELGGEIIDDPSPVTFGGESGYASPTDLTENTEVNFEITQKNILKSFYVSELQNEFIKDDEILDPMANNDLSNSWSHGQWKKEKKDTKVIKRPDIRRVIATDLCVTEL